MPVPLRQRARVAWYLAKQRVMGVQKFPLVVTGVIFGRPFSVGLRKECGSNASEPLLVYSCRNSRL